MAWQGKRLESLSGNGLTASYTYDEQGIRSGKTINGVTTSFSYNGSLLMAQVAPGKSLLFSYDANGQAVSVNYNGTEYYYLRNGQNDIVGLMDESGVRVVEYIYDAWGKLISTTGTLATTLGADNPFRYRGYYYDTDTGLYYLKSRYYDPEICRFINADGYASTGQGILGTNMFAYCRDNPVNYTDSAGDKGFKSVLARAIIKNLMIDSIIHRRVQLRVSQDNPGVTYKNPMIIYNSGGRYKGGYGFCDLYNPETGEVWEVKKYTVDGESARKQLENYTKGRLNANLGLPLKVGTSPLILNSFEEEVFGNVYQVNCYADPDVQGLIRYNYYRSAENDVKARQAFFSPAAEGSFNGIFPFLPFPGLPGFGF